MLCKHIVLIVAVAVTSRRLPWPQLNVTLCVYCMLYYILWTRRFRVVFSDSDLGVFFVVFLSFCAFLAWCQNRHACNPEQPMCETREVRHGGTQGSEDVYQLRWS